MATIINNISGTGGSEFQSLNLWAQVFYVNLLKEIWMRHSWENVLVKKILWFSWICLNFLHEFLVLYEILGNRFL